MATQSPGKGDIFVVEPDPISRNELSTRLSWARYEVTCFADGTALLMVARWRCPTCIILDLGLPSKSGLLTLEELSALDYPAPVIMISDGGTIGTAVSAIKRGAADFLLKPVGCEDLVQSVELAVKDRSQRKLGARGRMSPDTRGRDSLTRRESEILEQVMTGNSNKEIGLILGISPRTVEDHRARVLKKLGAKNTAELIRLVLA
ncbi:response regulator transcription factor [Bradyrhizobium sp.]|jgi:FixJ family two-component response regulator|uniref:response regulator transcription factor n=1 Tax=Bradyrhizobium sp. TaxID=376 RepID=UPI003D0FB9E2